MERVCDLSCGSQEMGQKSAVRKRPGVLGLIIERLLDTISLFFFTLHCLLGPCVFFFLAVVRDWDNCLVFILLPYESIPSSNLSRAVHHYREMEHLFVGSKGRGGEGERG